MGIHITDTDSDTVLFTERNGNTGRTIIVQFNTHDCGGRYHYRYELTDLERKALIQALTLPTDAPAPECFHGDHVPGCEHVPGWEYLGTPAALSARTGPDVDWFAVGQAIIAPDLVDQEADAEHRLSLVHGDGPDPMDDPHGHREPAF